MLEIDHFKDFENWVSNEHRKPAAIQTLDLLSYENNLIRTQFKGCLFLGCKLSNLSAGHIVNTGGMVIRDNHGYHFQVHRAFLYRPKELFRGFSTKIENGYHETFDYKIYKEYVDHGMENPSSIHTSLMRRLHDHSITDALNEEIAGRKVVAIMGGHSMERSDEFYLKIAQISRTLTQKGYLMVSGGGPGAMEATHVGAYFAARSKKDMLDAIHILKVRPKGAKKGQEYADSDWLKRALTVMEKYPIPKGKEKEAKSIGIPTWLYGHEPPAPFATHIAKYFANSVREDGLLTIAKHGVIFAPGSAGTIQEIFQDATQNHYASDNKSTVPKFISPMILLGKKYWTTDKPLWDFFSFVAKGKPYSKLLCLLDNEKEIVAEILEYRAEDNRFGG